MESGRVRPSHGQGRYCVVSPKEPNIVDMKFLPIRFPRQTIGRRHPRRFPQNSASVEEQGDDHCGSEPSRCIIRGKGYLDKLIRVRRAHLLPLVLDARGR